MKLAWGGEEIKPENSVSKQSIDKRRITTVKRLQKAEISSYSSSSVQMNKHQVRRLAIWHLSSCLVTRFLRGKIIKQIHTHTHTHTYKFTSEKSRYLTTIALYFGDYLLDLLTPAIRLSFIESIIHHDFVNFQVLHENISLSSCKIFQV